MRLFQHFSLFFILLTVTTLQACGTGDPCNDPFAFASGECLPPAKADAKEDVENLSDYDFTVREDDVLRKRLVPADSKLSFKVVEEPANGTARLDGAKRTFTYQPNPNFNGEETLKVVAQAYDWKSEPVTIRIVVEPVNDAPVPVSDAVSVDEDSSLLIAVLKNDGDIDGDDFSVSAVTQPTDGKVVINDDGTLTYTPEPDFYGVNVFSYIIEDPYGARGTATVTVNVTPMPDTPVAGNDAATTAEDTPVLVAVLSNDSDVDHETLTVSAVTNGAHGTATISGNRLQYAPALNYFGTDRFIYTAADPTGRTVTAAVDVTVTPVNDAPVGDTKSVTTDEDIAQAIVLTGSDVDSSTLTYAVVDQPQHGTLSGTAPNLTYTPAANYNGSDSFTFRVADDLNLQSGLTTVSITINPVNDAPVANAQAASTNEDTPKGIILTGSDIDSVSLTYVLVSSPANGTLTGTAPNLTYTPNGNYFGGDSFTFRVEDDASGVSNTATVTLTVTSVNDLPVANAQAVSTNEDTQVAITLTGSDVETASLTYVVDSQPAHGTLAGTGAGRTYTPDADWNGSDSFTFHVEDADGGASSSVTVSITVDPVNDAPVAYAQSVTTEEDTAKSITLTGSDIDSVSLTYVVVGSPANGTLSGTAPDLTYTPNANFYGADSFTFRIEDDATGISNTVTVTVTVNSVNDLPVADAQSLSTNEDTALPITLTGNDVETAALTYVVDAQPANGTLTGTGANRTYTPDADWSGSDSFTFHVEDADGGASGTVTVDITVDPVNDVPVADAQAVATNEDSPKAITLTGSDVDGFVLNYTVSSAPAHGTLSGSGATLTYTPAADYAGSDSFTFTAWDDSGAPSAAATVSITVNPVNDAPVAIDGGDTTDEDVALSIVLSALVSDVDDTSFTWSVQNPSHGTLSGSAPNLTYTPDADWSGADSFTFSATDPDGLATSVATFSITVNAVNDKPEADAKSATLAEDGSTVITFSGQDADLDVLTYSVASNPANGTLSGTGGTRTYTPNANFNGSDSFTYRAYDGSVNSDPVTVSLSITAVNDVPVASGASFTAKSGIAQAITLTGSDVEGSSLSYSVVANPSHGTLTGTAPSLTYTASAAYTGADSFTFKVNDGDADSATATISITVEPNTHTVSASAGSGGSISPTSVDVTNGNTTSFTLTPNTGYEVDSVSGCSGSLSGNTYTTGSITSPCAVSATFKLKTYTVTASAGTGGSISPPSTNVSHGSTASFNVIANSGYTISSVTGCGGSLSGTTFTTGAVTAACAVTATFSAVVSTYDFANLGADNGAGFKPQGDRFLVSTKYTNDGTSMYYEDGGTSISGAIIKADGVNLLSFDLLDMTFSIYANDTVSLTITATLAGGGTKTATVSNFAMATGNSYSLVSAMGANLTGFDNVTQLSFNITAGEVWNLNFDTIKLTDQKAPAVIGTRPTTQVSNLQASVVSADQIGLRWTNGNGSRRIVFIKSGATTGAPPVVDGITYPTSTNFGGAMDIGGGWRPVYKGTGDSVLVTGLTASTAYRIVVFEYDGQGGGEAYLTTVGTNALNKSTISSFATWTSGTVRSLLDKNFWTYPSAGIGADGYTYVVHFDYDSDTETAKRVVVSRWNGTAWSTHASFTASDAGLSGLSDYLSIAVDASNTVHIAFMGYTGSGVTSTRGVAYARYNGSWLFESVEMNSHPSGWLNTSKPFIAVDASSVPHIAYDLVDASVHQQHSKLATRTGASTWSKTTWKSNPSNSNENVKEWRLKADANGKLHLVYILNLISGDDELHYYTNASGSWVDATLASSSFTMYDAYLGLDSNNKAHATYSTGSTTYDSYYLTNKSGSWVSTLLSANSTNYPQGVLINSSNEIVIPTGDGTTQRLFYLDAGSSEWQLSNPSTADADRESVPAATFSNDGKVVLVYANNLSSRPRKLSYFQAVIP